ncbi:hypothetical protein BDR05DRAFT_253632 [Suillus weaverae]|nr:hypothetical protein BDR05DRAFT_253632 [Suillus weaverae]
MDIFDHSDSVESQPTQLLQHALTKHKSIAEHSDKWGLNRECEQEGNDKNFSTNFSIDSMMIPPARGSTSRYQLNWLAPTQTQPQVLHREDEIVEEGSQKENTPASNKNKHENVARTRSSSPQASSAKPINHLVSQRRMPQSLFPFSLLVQHGLLSHFSNLPNPSL